MTQGPKIADHNDSASRWSWARAYAAGLFVFYALEVLLRSAFPALGDYSDWTYQGVLLRNHLLRLPDTAHVLKHYPVPNDATTVGIGLLALVFSWQLAARLWLCVLFALSFFASSHMMRTVRGNAAMWLIAPGAIFLNVNLWYGFVNFQLGLGCAVLMASLLLRGETRDSLYGGLLLVAFFAHMVPFAFCGLMLIIYALQHGRLRLLWQLLPASIMSLWYLAGRFGAAHNADGAAGMISSVRNYSAAFWAYKGNSYLKSFGFINPGDASGSVTAHLLGPAAYLLLLGLNLLLCAAVGWLLVASVVSAYRRAAEERFLWTAALLLLPLYLLVPGTALGISDPGSRLLQVSLAAAIFLCRERSRVGRWAMRTAAASAVVLQLIAFLLFTWVVFTPKMETANVAHLPHELVVFAHIPNHDRDLYLDALSRGDMQIQVFPTGMFLNTASSESMEKWEPSRSGNEQ